MVFREFNEGGSEGGVVCTEVDPLLSVSVTEALSLKYCSNIFSTSIKSLMEGGVPGAYCSAFAVMVGALKLPELLALKL